MMSLTKIDRFIKAELDVECHNVYEPAYVNTLNMFLKIIKFARVKQVKNALLELYPEMENEYDGHRLERFILTSLPEQQCLYINNLDITEGLSIIDKTRKMQKFLKSYQPCEEEFDLQEYFK